MVFVELCVCDSDNRKSGVSVRECLVSTIFYFVVLTKVFGRKIRGLGCRVGLLYIWTPRQRVELWFRVTVVPGIILRCRRSFNVGLRFYFKWEPKTAVGTLRCILGFG